MKWHLRCTGRPEARERHCETQKCFIQKLYIHTYIHTFIPRVQHSYIHTYIHHVHGGHHMPRDAYDTLCIHHTTLLHSNVHASLHKYIPRRYALQKS